MFHMEIPLDNLLVYEAPCYDAKCSAVFKGNYLFHCGFVRLPLGSLLHDEVAVKSLGSGDTSRATVSIFSGEPPCPDLLRDLKHECSIMRRLTHKNIVRFKGVLDNPPSIITEYCAKGSLWNIIAECHDSTKAFFGINDEAVWMWRINIALQIAKGMYYLHWQVPIVIHNDLKSPNVFIDDNWVVKIGDFGSAIVGDEECRNPPDNNRWRSPEQMRNQKPTSKSDVFSFAVILWELYSFDRPWDNLCESSSYPAKIAVHAKNSQIREKILKGERLKFPDNVVGGKCNGIQGDFRRLIELCWHPDPDTRPDFGKIIEILDGFQKRVKKTKSGLEDLRMMSMKDLLLKNHPSRIAQEKISSSERKSTLWSSLHHGSQKDDSVKRPISKHSQRKWKFFNMMKLVQKVKPSFMGASKKPSSSSSVTTNHSKDSYSYLVESDQSSGSVGCAAKQLKSPFEMTPGKKLNDLSMGNELFNKAPSQDDSAKSLSGFYGQSLNSKSTSFNSNKTNSTLDLNSEMVLSQVQDLSEEDTNDRLIEFEESLHDYFANESSPHEGLDTYIQFAKEFHDGVKSELVL